MKTSSPTPAPVVLSSARARNAVLLNQLATPGLGSLLARRWFAGTGQLLLALAGFVLLLVWFVQTMRDYYGLMFDAHADPHTTNFGLKYGALVFLAAWLWSLVTSFQILNSVKTPVPGAPPPLPK